jgi:hypothetical protein
VQRYRIMRVVCRATDMSKVQKLTSDAMGGLRVVSKGIRGLISRDGFLGCLECEAIDIQCPPVTRIPASPLCKHHLHAAFRVCYHLKMLLGTKAFSADARSKGAAVCSRDHGTEFRSCKAGSRFEKSH